MLQSSTSACDSDSTVALQSWKFPKNKVLVLTAVFWSWSQGLQTQLGVPSTREGQCSPELWPESKCWHSCTAQRTVLPRERQQHFPGTRCLLPGLNSQLVTRNRRAGASPHEVFQLYLNDQTLGTAVLTSVWPHTALRARPPFPKQETTAATHWLAAASVSRA